MYEIVAIIQSLINQNQRIFKMKFNSDITPVSNPIKTKPSSFIILATCVISLIQKTGIAFVILLVVNKMLVLLITLKSS